MGVGALPEQVFHLLLLRWSPTGDLEQWKCRPGSLFEKDSPVGRFDGVEQGWVWKAPKPRCDFGFWVCRRQSGGGAIRPLYHSEGWLNTSGVFLRVINKAVRV